MDDGIDPLITAAKNYVLAVLIGLDVLINAILGGRRYQTISSRIGESMTVGGWAASIPWPAWFRNHCAAAVYDALV